MAIVNNASVNIGLHVSFVIIVFSEYIPRNAILFSIVGVPIYIATSSVGGLSFIHNLISIIVDFNDIV